MSNYTVLEKATNSGFHTIRITEGDYEGIEFCYGEVTLNEEAGEAILKFNFDVLLDVGNILVTDEAKDAFGQYIGDILTIILREQIENNDVVYAGGTNS